MYKVFVQRYGYKPEVFKFRDPLDALLCGIDYLKKGYQARLSDTAVQALEDLVALPPRGGETVKARRTCD